jgi:anti-sigma B factor antagonist
MESIERKTETYAVVFNVNLLRATLNEATEFKDYLEEAILDTDKDIIVNLGACEHLDSTFLGVLVSGYKRLKIQNRSLVIIEPVDQSSIFLTLNSIGKIFPLYSSVKVALEDIENKKLIEKEINELGNQRVKPIEKPAKAPFKISSFPLVDSPEETIPEETIQEELHSENLMDIDKEIDNEPVLENIITEENDLILIENDSPDKGPENPFTLKTEDVIPDKNTSQSNLDDLKADEMIFTKLQHAYEDRRFSSGTVKWEFGFS